MKCNTRMWMMMSVVLALAPVCGSAAPADAGSSCDLSTAVMNGWKSTDSASSSRRPNSGTEIPFGHAISVRLHPFQQVHFATDTGEKHEARGFAGNLVLTIRKDGTYRFLVDDSITLEVASNGRKAEIVDQGAIAGCDSVKYYVEYQLVRGSYALQLSGSHKHAVKVLATMVD